MLIPVFLYCCTNNKKREAEDIVKNWLGKKIYFPKNITCIHNDNTICPDFLMQNYKILLYMDSIRCMSCDFHLDVWQNLIRETDSLFQEKVSFFFFLHLNGSKEYKSLFQENSFFYPVFIDSTNQIDRINHFPLEEVYHCFLLDKTNKIQVIGNPTLSPKIWNLYKNKIAGTMVNNKVETTTTVEMNSSLLNFGNIPVKQKTKYVVKIKNTGKNPLIINGVSKSCGCTNVKWEKQPILTGKSTNIDIEMIPEDSGYFTKNIYVFCNVKEGGIALNIKGTAR